MIQRQKGAVCWFPIDRPVISFWDQYRIVGFVTSFQKQLQGVLRVDVLLIWTNFSHRRIAVTRHFIFLLSQYDVFDRHFIFGQGTCFIRRDHIH